MDINLNSQITVFPKGLKKINFYIIHSYLKEAYNVHVLRSLCV